MQRKINNMSKKIKVYMGDTITIFCIFKFRKNIKNKLKKIKDSNIYVSSILIHVVCKKHFFNSK
jgi:hypothetical protein